MEAASCGSKILEGKFQPFPHYQPLSSFQHPRCQIHLTKCEFPGHEKVQRLWPTLCWRTATQTGVVGNDVGTQINLQGATGHGHTDTVLPKKSVQWFFLSKITRISKHECFGPGMLGGIPLLFTTIWDNNYGLLEKRKSSSKIFRNQDTTFISFKISMAILQVSSIVMQALKLTTEASKNRDPQLHPVDPPIQSLGTKKKNVDS